MKIVAWEAWEAAKVAAAVEIPPNNHVMVVSNIFTAMSGILWSASYILLARKAFKDKSYGMPIYSLCLNITCECVYGFIYGPDFFNQMIYAQWMIVDVFLLVATIKFGASAWSHTPIVANNLGWIILTACIICLWAQLALAAVLVPVIGRKVVFLTSWTAQVVLSVGSVEQIMSRGSTKGHSWSIWWTRMLGTLAAASCFYWRAYFWPERFGYALDPIGAFLLIISHVFDFAYPFVYSAIRRKESTHDEPSSKNVKSHHVKHH